MIYRLLLLLLLSVTSTFAQTDMLEITILDKDDRTPVAYATIMFPAQQYGFSANEKGQFRLPVQQVERDKKIVITSIGYEPYSNSLEEMINDKVDTIFLQSKITILEEILVKAENVTPGEMVLNASKSLKNFLGTDPYYLYAFYKESIKRGGEYVGYSEAQGMLHVSGYQASYNRKNELFSYDIAQWKNLRRAYYIITSACDSEKKRPLAIDKLLKSKSEYIYSGPLNKSRHDNFKYTTDSLTSFENTDVFIIGFEPLTDDVSFSGKLYIKVDDYALIGMEVEDNAPSAVVYDNCNLPQASSKFNLTFTKIDERYYLNTTRLTLRYTMDSKPVIEEIELRSNEFNNNATQSLNYDQRMVVYQEMLNPSVAYEPSFWKNHGANVPEQIVDDLGQAMSMEEQFFANSGKRPIPLPKEYDSYEELYKDQDVFRLFVNTDF